MCCGNAGELRREEGGEGQGEEGARRRGATEQELLKRDSKPRSAPYFRHRYFTRPHIRSPRACCTLFPTPLAVSLAHRELTKREHPPRYTASLTAIPLFTLPPPLCSHMCVAHSSSFVVCLYATFSDADCLYFLMEFVQGGDLMAYMIEQGTLSNDVAIFLSACITEAVKHIHVKGFVHRDIKPENCLVTTMGYLQVADLGLAKRLPAVVEVGRGRTEISLLAFTMCGTPEFMAPEFCMSVGYDQAADWWALGCVLFEMYMGRNPFDTGGDLKRTFKDICMIGMGKSKLQLHPKFKTTFPNAANILESCLTHAAGRIGKKDDIQGHPYFGEIDFDMLRKKEADAPYVPTVQSDTDLFYFEKSLPDVEVGDLPKYSGDEAWCQDF